MRTAGYWIKPSGEVLKAEEQHHSEMVVSNPKLFGFTPLQLKKIFTKHKETKYIKYIGKPHVPDLAGKAEDEILITLIKDGWIRIRQIYDRQGMNWYIYLKNPMYLRMESTRNDIKNWALEVIARREATSNEQVFFMFVDGSPDTWGSFKELFEQSKITFKSFYKYLHEGY